MVEMKCEQCGSFYELTEDEFEEREEHKANDLCPVCLDDLIEGQAEKPVKRCFEYKDIATTINDKINFNELGQDGWELVTISNSYAYFKREYFKEGSNVN